MNEEDEWEGERGSRKMQSEREREGAERGRMWMKIESKKNRKDDIASKRVRKEKERGRDEGGVKK